MSGWVPLFLFVDGGARLAGFAAYVDGMTQFALGVMAWGGLWLRYAGLRELIPVMKRVSAPG